MTGMVHDDISQRLERMEVKLDKLNDRFVDLKIASVTWRQVAGISAFISTGIGVVFEVLKIGFHT